MRLRVAVGQWGGQGCGTEEEGSLRAQATSWEPHVPPHTLPGSGVAGMTAEEAEGIGFTGL